MASKTTPLIAVDHAGRLTCDLPCVRCGYNLRGLLPNGVCGECGLDIQFSAAGSALGGADPRWVRKLRWGTATFTLALPWLWLPLAWPIAWLGCWRMAEPEPAGGRGAPATVARLVLVVAAAAFSTWLGLAYGDPTLFDWSSSLAILLAMVAVFLACATLAVWRLNARHARRSERRLVGMLLLAWLLGPPLMALFAVADVLPPSGELAVDAFGLLGGVIALGIPILLPMALVRQWRELEIAEALLGDQHRVNVRMTPAAGSSAAATSPPGSTAPRPAEA